MRLLMIGGMVTGIGMTLLALSIFLDISQALYTFIGCVICVVIVVVIAVINSLTTWAGYVHPDDRLWTNILAYVLVLYVLLTFGRFASIDPGFLFTLFNTGTMLLLALVLLVGFVALSGKFQLRDMLEGTGSVGHMKEISARVILLSLLVGVILAVIQLGLGLLYWFLVGLFAFPLGYYYSAVAVGGIATLIVFLIGFYLRFRYEPISTSTE